MRKSTEEVVEATEEVVESTPKVSCENCGDSGKECIECGAGRQASDLEL